MSTQIPASNHQGAPERDSAQLPKYLHRRGKNFYFKRRIPTDVAHGFPQFHGQVWKSLDTDFLAKAKVFLAVELTEFDMTVAGLRRTRALESAASLAGRAINSRSNVVNAAGHAVTKPATPLPLGLNSALHRQPQTTAIANTVPAPAPPKSSDWVPVATKPCVRQKTSAPDATPTMHRPGPGRLIAPTMFHLFEDWKRNQTRPRTINAVHTAVMEFRTLHGPLIVEALTKQHARAYRDYLIGRQLSKLTIENRLGFLSTLMRYGMRELVEHLSLNPFERIDVTGAQGRRAPKDRRAYSSAELNVIFASRLYTDGYGWQAV